MTPSAPTDEQMAREALEDAFAWFMMERGLHELVDNIDQPELAFAKLPDESDKHHQRRLKKYQDSLREFGTWFNGLLREWEKECKRWRKEMVKEAEAKDGKAEDIASQIDALNSPDSQ